MYLTNGWSKNQFAIGFWPFAICAYFSGNKLGLGMNTKTVSRVNIIAMAINNNLFEDMGILNGLATPNAIAVVTY